MNYTSTKFQNKFHQFVFYYIFTLQLRYEHFFSLYLLAGSPVCLPSHCNFVLHLCHHWHAGNPSVPPNQTFKVDCSRKQRSVFFMFWHVAVVWKLGTGWRGRESDQWTQQLQNLHHGPHATLQVGIIALPWFISYLSMMPGFIYNGSVLVTGAPRERRGMRSCWLVLVGCRAMKTLGMMETCAAATSPMLTLYLSSSYVLSWWELSFLVPLSNLLEYLLFDWSKMIFAIFSSISSKPKQKV